MATVAVDLDGVCYEWHRTYIYMMRRYRGVEFPGDWREWWTEWDSPDEYTTPADREWMWSEGVQLGLFRHGHVTRDAVLGLTKLARQGHELVVATHRPKQAVRDTINWLDHHFGGLDPYPWTGVNILSNREPKTVVKADILVDDKAENVLAWWSFGRDAILFDRPWNTGVGTCVRPCRIEAGSHLVRATGWSDVIEAVEEMSG